MRNTKPPVKYHSLSLPVDFIKEIKEHIKDIPRYRSIADFAKTAMNEKMYLEKSAIHLDKTGKPAKGVLLYRGKGEKEWKEYDPSQREALEKKYGNKGLETTFLANIPHDQRPADFLKKYLEYYNNSTQENNYLKITEILFKKVKEITDNLDSRVDNIDNKLEKIDKILQNIKKK